MRLRLPKDARSPLLARAFVRRSLCEGHSREARDEVELLVSELVTNAVVHGGSLVTLDVDCETPDGIAVSVTDSSSVRPQPRVPGPLDESGRGMQLVALISDAWGVREAGVPADEPGPTTGPTTGPATGGAAGGPLASLLAAVPRQARGKSVWFHLAG